MLLADGLSTTRPLCPKSRRRRCWKGWRSERASRGEALVADTVQATAEAARPPKDRVVVPRVAVLYAPAYQAEPDLQTQCDLADALLGLSQPLCPAPRRLPMTTNDYLPMHLRTEGPLDGFMIHGSQARIGPSAIRFSFPIRICNTFMSTLRHNKTFSAHHPSSSMAWRTHCYAFMSQDRTRWPAFLNTPIIPMRACLFCILFVVKLVSSVFS